MSKEDELVKYESQLNDVNKLLALSPKDDTLIKLKADLVNLIKLTKQITETEKKSSSATISTHDNNNTEAKQWTIGQKCLALWQDGRYYIAQIYSLPTDDERITVTYLQYGETVELRISQIKPFVPPPISKLSRGVEISAPWNDGLYYPGIIEGMLPNGNLNVKFRKHKKRVEVSPVDVVLLKDNDPLNISDVAVIPESLKVLPGDSEKVREQKKKRIKKFKYEHKKKVEEVTNTKRKNVWQNFQQNVKKKRSGGAFRKPSMFSS